MYSNDELKYSKINFTAFKVLKVNWKKHLKDIVTVWPILVANNLSKAIT